MGNSAANSIFGRGWLRSAFVAVGLCTLLFARTVAAESENAAGSSSLFDSKFAVALGGYFPYVDSDVTLGSSGGPGIPVDLENDLGLKQWSASAWLSFNWRFLPRHQLHVEWFQLNRDGSATAERSLDIGGSIFTAGVQLNSALDLDIGRITYGYSIIRDDRNDFSFHAGAHVATAKATITGTGMISVDGAPVSSTTHTESSSTITFPLPHFGLSYSRVLTPKLGGRVTLLAFALDLGNFSGHLLEVDGTVAYQITKSFGIGGGLKYYNVNMTSKDSSGDTTFDMQFLGPTIFIYGNF